MIDTHTHLYLPQFDNDRADVIKRSIESGVDICLMPNIDKNSVDAMLDMCNKYPKICYPMLGLHPTSVYDDYHQQIDYLFSLCNQYPFIAIGEIGLDFYWDTSHIEQQKEALHIQINCALERNLPVVIHSRNAMKETLEAIDLYKGKGLKGILHAFAGDVDDALYAIENGFLLGIGGQITYKKSKMVEVVRKVGLEHIVLETDSPYLPPIPHRGERNESSYIPIICHKVAEILELDTEKVAEATTRNARQLFFFEK